MTEYSIKKPMTIVVAVILILVLGVVSFMNMKTDLLPAMEMPYVMVVTVYPGATPEKVEQAVSKPLESSLSTVAGVENIKSQSAENLSMLAIEFTYDTNMDTAMIDLNNKLGSVTATLEDGVGAPIMMQINPDMLPIYVASVSKDGADLQELTNVTNSIVIPALERSDGVASCMAIGTLMHTVEITLNPDKIDRLNEKIVAFSNEQSAAALGEINKGKNALTAAKKELEQQKQSASMELAKAGIAIADGKTAISVGIAAMEGAEKQLDQMLTLLTQVEKDLKALGEPEKLDQLAERTGGTLADLALSMEDASQALGELSLQLEQLDSEQIPWDALERLLAANPDALQKVREIRAYLMGAVGKDGTLTKEIKRSASDLSADAKRLDAMAKDLIAMKPGTKWNEIISMISAYRKQMEDAKAQLPAQKQDLNKKLKELTAQQEKVEQGKIILSTELASAAQKIQSSEDQLKAGEKALEDALHEAAGKAGLSSLLDAKMLKTLIAAQNFSMPAGYLNDGKNKFAVKVGDSFKDEKDLAAMPLLVSDNKEIGTITLADVADLVTKDNSEDRFAKVNGSDGILLSLQKQSTASTNEVSKAVKHTIEQLQKDHPGLEIGTMMDQGIYIDTVIQSVLQSLVTGGLLAIIILFVFLRSVKATLVVAFSIPISLTLAVVCMYFTGVDINIVSLAGLALGVGMLVDNSIVVIENTYRLRAMGVPAGKAALSGAKQVAGAITASTLTTVCVFLPIVFTKGMSRQLFTDMGLTIAYSLMASLLVALSLVPVLSATMLRNLKKPPENRRSRIKETYGKMLNFCLKQKWLPIVLSITLLGVSIYGSTRLGTAFIPDSVADQLAMIVSLPDGEEVTSEKLRDRSLAVMDALCELDDVQMVGVYENNNQNALPAGQKESMTVYVVMAEKKSKSAKKVMDDIRKKAEEVDGCETTLTSGMNMMSYMNSGLEIKVSGQDVDQLRELAGQTAALLNQTEGIHNVDDGFGDQASEIRVSVRKEEAMKHQLTVAQVYQQVAQAIQNSVSVTSLSMAEENIDVLLCKHAEDRLTFETLKDYPLTYQDMMTENMKTVPLSDVADVTMATGLTTIGHENFKRVVTVSGELKDGYNIGLVSRDLEKDLKNMNVPKGCSVSIVGENEMINSMLRDVLLMVLLAVLMIYLIMVAQFQSLTGPFVVMFTIPLAFTGGLLALWLFGFELSVISVLGFLVLAGVVVNNGIVFVDTSNQLQKNGMSRREALIETGKMRLRPIFMTAATTVLGLTSLAFGIGTGADMLQPLAIVVVFGLSYATLLTLFVVPVLCDGIFMRKPMRDIQIEGETRDDLIPQEPSKEEQTVPAKEPDSKPKTIRVHRIRKPRRSTEKKK